MSVNNLLLVLCLLGVFSISSAGLWSSNGGDAKEDNPSSGGTFTTTDEPVEYGVDVSFPMQYVDVSTNYPWLPHNQDPSLPVPKEYKDMVLQPLGNKQEFYRDFLQGCKDAFGKKGTRCTQNELDRIAMTLRQPQSMQNYVSLVESAIRNFLYLALETEQSVIAASYKSSLFSCDFFSCYIFHRPKLVIRVRFVAFEN